MKRLDAMFSSNERLINDNFSQSSVISHSRKTSKQSDDGEELAASISRNMLVNKNFSELFSVPDNKVGLQSDDSVAASGKVESVRHTPHQSQNTNLHPDDGFVGWSCTVEL